MKDFEFGTHISMPHNLDVSENGVLKIAVHMQETVENAIIDEITKAAMEQGITDLYILDKQNIISALQKQIPKKLDTKIINRGIDITGEYDIDSDYLCPTCKCVVGDCETEDYWYKYCPDCGQALDWSETE